MYLLIYYFYWTLVCQDVLYVSYSQDLICKEEALLRKMWIYVLFTLETSQARLQVYGFYDNQWEHNVLMPAP